jgi:hypothetical protein
LLEGKQSNVDLFHHTMVQDGDGEAQRPDALDPALNGGGRSPHAHPDRLTNGRRTVRQGQRPDSLDAHKIGSPMIPHMAAGRSR